MRMLNNNIPEGLNVMTVSSSGMERHSITSHAPLDSMPEMMATLADTVSKKDAGVALQVIFAPPGTAEKGQRCLEAAFGSPRWPVTWLEYPAGNASPFLSSQTFAVSSSPVRPLEMDGRIVGTLFESEYATCCLLGNIAPSDTSVPRQEQCRLVLEKIEQVLSNVGMSFRTVMRSWFYLNEILSWYGEFNAARSAFFAEHGVMPGSLPASTGVGASNPMGAAIVCNALAIQSKNGDACVQEIESPLQCPAPDYRSSFSRAVEVTVPGCRSLYVSGTASIDRDGITAHVGDIDGQLALTMEAVQGILRSRGMNWTDVTSAVAYFKNVAHLPRLHSFMESRALSPFPLAIAPADICRDELLFEVEVEATSAAPIEQTHRRNG